MRKVSCPNMPDWAPDNAGEILFQDGKWVLVRDYLYGTREETVCAIHLCTNGIGEGHIQPALLTNDGKCLKCEVEATDAFIGFYNMAVWKP